MPASELNQQWPWVLSGAQGGAGRYDCAGLLSVGLLSEPMLHVRPISAPRWCEGRSAFASKQRLHALQGAEEALVRP